MGGCVLTLTLRAAPPGPIEVDGITPDRLAGLTSAAVERLPVQVGRHTEALGEFFRVEGDASDLVATILGGCERVKGIGAGMSAGSLFVEGDVGMHAGAEMAGGRLEIRGDADDWLGVAMTGGEIRCRGRAGHHVGAAYPGARRGMRGGTLLVDGPVGDGCGAVMRRGLIATGGVGDYCGASMIAGTIIVAGPLARLAGMAMKRGTIVALGAAPELLPTFRFSCVYEPRFVDLYRRRLERLGYAALPWPHAFHRYCGDSVALGLGEVLTARSAG